MGVNIRSKNSKYSFYMGGGGFFNLRKNIAYVVHPVLGDLYSEILKMHTSEEHEELDKRTTGFLATTDIESKYHDVLDFLYASDISGQLTLPEVLASGSVKSGWTPKSPDIVVLRTNAKL